MFATAFVSSQSVLSYNDIILDFHIFVVPYTSMPRPGTRAATKAAKKQTKRKDSPPSVVTPEKKKGKREFQVFVPTDKTVDPFLSVGLNDPSEKAYLKQFENAKGTAYSIVKFDDELSAMTFFIKKKQDAIDWRYDYYMSDAAEAAEDDEPPPLLSYGDDGYEHSTVAKENDHSAEKDGEPANVPDVKVGTPACGDVVVKVEDIPSVAAPAMNAGSRGGSAFVEARPAMVVSANNGAASIGFASNLHRLVGKFTPTSSQYAENSQSTLHSTNYAMTHRNKQGFCKIGASEHTIVPQRSTSATSKTSK